MINLYNDIKNIIELSRNNAVRAVNFSMVVAYWEIGKCIVEEEQGGKKRAGYGDALLQELSNKLSKEFGKGFTITNLKYFRQFYLAFPPIEKSHALRDESFFNMQVIQNTALRPELSWTHYRLLIKVEKQLAREYYIKECIEKLEYKSA